MSEEQYKIDRHYLLDLLKAHSELKRQIELRHAEREKWQVRLGFARERNRTELVTAAENRIAEETASLDSLEIEMRRLLIEVESARKRLEKSTLGRHMQTDAVALLSELEALAGSPDKLAASAGELDAAAHLAELKERFGTGSPPEEHTKE